MVGTQVCLTPELVVLTLRWKCFSQRADGGFISLRRYLSKRPSTLRAVALNLLGLCLRGT